MITVEKGILEGYKGSNVPYSFLKQESSSKVAVIFPGQGYTNQAPLLYYSTSLLVSEGYHVLHMNYQYHTEPYTSFSDEEKKACIRYNAEKAFTEILSQTDFSELLILGKSIGTASIASILGKLTENTKVVWLTPLLTRDETFHAMMDWNGPSLSIIGDEDPIYRSERWKELEEKANYKTKLYSGADHSLDLKNKPVESIQLMEKVIQTIKEFLQ
ncbi:alpha/beta family hydrolase [Bacillus sp. 31A1R]|uniref:Alpha/beta family hydrolase n=1 Tax=Robertmurraya mangrovi TaxID=3098077 RepID=A0ABU5J1X0_9BACI|nr:alpha/beta family hydrolase [Bacillus sp. 31A1R]MDZ5473394.1 alpha/beta family hydrolase [Bacillus sp. 31A1R]